MYTFFSAVAGVSVGLLVAAGILRLAIHQGLFQYETQGDQMEYTKQDLDVTSTKPVEAEVVDEKAVIEASHPTRFNGHEHHFISGLAPGGRNLRICDVPGCGYTEGL
jgi:hypothetical protein